MTPLTSLRTRWQNAYDKKMAFRSAMTSRIPIQKNLARKIKKGTYDRTLALKAWGYLMETAAKKYVKEFGGGSWYTIFPVPARKEAAQLFRDDFEAEVKAGGVEQFLR